MRKRSLLLILLTGAIALSVVAAPQVQAQTLNVQQFFQIRTMWCWDACCQMMLDYNGVTVSQTAIATWVFGSPPPNNGNWLCATNTGMDDVMNNWGVPGYSCVDRPLTRAEIEDQMNLTNPVAIRYDWDAGGAHALVLRGFNDQGDANPANDMVLINDPWFGTLLCLYDVAVDDGIPSPHRWTRSMTLGVPGGSGIDVVFIVDMTGSASGQKPAYDLAINRIATVFEAFAPDSRYALTYHHDFPFAPYGGPGDVAYGIQTDFVASPAQLGNPLFNLPAGGGNDGPESQITAIYQAITGDGVDFNQDWNYSDPGEIPNTKLSYLYNATTNPTPNSQKAFFLFSTPISFHNSDTDPNYPVPHGTNPGAALSCSENLLLAKLNGLGTTLFCMRYRSNPKSGDDDPQRPDDLMADQALDASSSQASSPDDDPESMAILWRLLDASGGTLIEFDESSAEDAAEEAVNWFIDSTVMVPNNIFVSIEKTHDAIQGQFEQVAVSVDTNWLEMGGFDFLVAYDASALALQSAIPGPAFYDPAPDGCGWEYFTYRQGPCGACAGGCPSGQVRVFGLAETNNGPNHPSCFVPDSLPATLFTLDFLVSNDRTLECMYAPIRFFWCDCGDNTISSVDGEVLYVSDHIYEFEGTDITDSTFGFPTYFGIQSGCIIPDPLKPNPLRLVNYTNGGVDIVCADSIDDRGDINLNGVVNEVADAVLYSNYFVHGISVFNVNIDGQIAASDVNADGITLSVADLVYMIRIITGDALPYPKLTAITANADLVNGVLSVNGDMGAAYIVVERAITPQLLAESMEMKYQYDADHDLTRILVYSMEKGRRFTGDFLGGIDGNVITLEVATYEGAPVTTKLVPEEFALYPSYPNPFNPVTTISFALASLVDYELVIYNSLGQTVKTFTGHAGPGLERVDWNASGFASGVYFYRLTAGDFTDTKKMVLLK